MNRIKTNRFFKKAQIYSSAFMAFMNGAQDGQKFMGVFMLGAFFALSYPITASFEIPLWLIIVSALTVCIGISAGSYKIIKTVGSKIVKMEMYEGTCADISCALCVFASIIFGIPISTTQTKSAAIMGVGASKRLSNVNWNVAKRMVLSWILIFPCCGLLSFIITRLVIAVVR